MNTSTTSIDDTNLYVFMYLNYVMGNNNSPYRQRLRDIKWNSLQLNTKRAYASRFLPKESCYLGRHKKT